MTKKVIISLYLAIYALILFADFGFFEIVIDIRCLKFLLIPMAFFISLKGSKTISLGLFVTIICDYILLFTNAYALGLIIFSSVHIIYSRKFQNKKDVLSITPFLTLSALIYSLAFYLDLSEAYKYKRYRRRRSDNVFFYGIILFALCDISTLFYNIGLEFFLPFIWLFYSPAQLLIALSSGFNELKYKKRNA